MAYFNLASIAEPTKLYRMDGYSLALMFDDAKSAIDYATANGLSGWKPKMVVDNSWISREDNRMYREYQRPVWHNELRSIPNHFCHVSLDELDKVAFTESPEKGMLDKQTRMLPGKYLSRFYPELTQPQIQEWTRVHAERYSNLRALWASTPDEIEEVYSMDAGFSSCVQHPASEFRSSVHPCRIYGAGDLSVAYLKNAAGTLLSRALVWRSQGRVGRVYGEVAILRKALLAEGITTTSDQHDYDILEGARLLKIKEDGWLVAPYIDGTGYVEDHGDHLTTSGNERHIRCSTPSCDQTGYQSAYDGEEEEEEDDRPYCPRCDEQCDDDDMVRVRVGSSMRHYEFWCDYCGDNHAFLSEGDDRLYSDDAFTPIEVSHSRHGGTDTYCLEASGDDLVHCERSDTYYQRDDAVELADGTYMGRDEFEADGFACGHDGLNYHTDDGVMVDGAKWSETNAKALAVLNADGETYTLEGADYAPPSTEIHELLAA